VFEPRVTPPAGHVVRAAGAPVDGSISNLETRLLPPAVDLPQDSEGPDPFHGVRGYGYVRSDQPRHVISRCASELYGGMGGAAPRITSGYKPCHYDRRPRLTGRVARPTRWADLTTLGRPENRNVFKNTSLSEATHPCELPSYSSSPSPSRRSARRRWSSTRTRSSGLGNGRHRSARPPRDPERPERVPPDGGWDVGRGCPSAGTSAYAAWRSTRPGPRTRPTDRQEVVLPGARGER
jgi:hypothetical protein